MLTCGAQLKAARSFIGIDQQALALVAGLNVNTIRAMEGSGLRPIPGRAANVHLLQNTLEEAGIEFLPATLDGRGPGVRVRDGVISPAFWHKLSTVLREGHRVIGSSDGRLGPGPPARRRGL